MSNKVLICGSGNTAHVLACLLSANPELELQVFTRNSHNATRWNDAIAQSPMSVIISDGASDIEFARGSPGISDNPEVAKNTDIVILAVPGCGHATYLQLLAPYIENGASIVGLPGQCGFEFEVRRVLGEKPVIAINFESSPWSCRLVEFGRLVKILGTKRQVIGAMGGDLATSRVADPLSFLRSILEQWTNTVASPSLLAITLMSVNAYTHPPIMYKKWKNWNGRSFRQAPSFYHGIDDATGALLARISGEVVKISRTIMQMHCDQDLSHVVPMLTWDRNSYGHEILDATSQATALRSNPVYRDLVHPMVDNGGGELTPNFEHRFMTEDVPYGLVPIRGIAELAGVDTPELDEVLRWCQDRVGKQYLCNSTLSGKDIPNTTCPQRYGIRTLKELL